MHLVQVSCNEDSLMSEEQISSNCETQCTVNIAVMCRIFCVDMFPTYMGFVNFGLVWSANSERLAYQEPAGREFLWKELLKVDLMLTALSFTQLNFALGLYKTRVQIPQASSGDAFQRCKEHHRA